VASSDDVVAIAFVFGVDPRWLSGPPTGWVSPAKRARLRRMHTQYRLRRKGKW